MPAPIWQPENGMKDVRRRTMMSLSIFGDKDILPNEESLAGVLAGSKTSWDEIKNCVVAECGNYSEEWKYYSKKAGWALVIKSEKRTILYLIPLSGCFKANFVFGEKAVAAAQVSGLPEPIIALISEATPYMEGRSFMVDITSEADAQIVKRLIAIKNAN
jgi:hypothetical protein